MIGSNLWVPNGNLFKIQILTILSIKLNVSYQHIHTITLVTVVCHVNIPTVNPF